MNENFMSQIATKDDYRVRENIKKLLDENSIYNAHIVPRPKDFQTTSNDYGSYKSFFSNLDSKNRFNDIYEAFDRKEPKIKNISVTHEDMLKGFQTENQSPKSKLEKLFDISSHETAKTKINYSEIPKEDFKIHWQPSKHHEIVKNSTYREEYNPPMPARNPLARLAKPDRKSNMKCLSHFTEEGNNRRRGKNKFFDESDLYCKNIDFKLPSCINDFPF